MTAFRDLQMPSFPALEACLTPASWTPAPLEPSSVTALTSAPTSLTPRLIFALTVDGNRHRLRFTDCLHAPQAALNLVSVGRMLERGWRCTFEGSPPHCDLSCQGKSLGSVPLRSGLCFLDLEFVHFDAPLPLTSIPTLTAFARVPITLDLWHARLGHAGQGAVKRLSSVAIVFPSNPQTALKHRSSWSWFMQMLVVRCPCTPWLMFIC